MKTLHTRKIEMQVMAVARPRDNENFAKTVILLDSGFRYRQLKYCPKNTNNLRMGATALFTWRYFDHVERTLQF